MFKSGTSSDYEDLWCLGATGSCTVGVWAGNLDGRPAFGTTGSTLPARIALGVFEALSSRGAAPTAVLDGWPLPAALREQRICLVSGRPASPWCPATRVEYLPVAADTAGPCPVHSFGLGGPRPGKLGEEEPAGHPAPQSLLVPLLAGPGGAPRILFPLPEQQFYRDGSVPEGLQRLEAWIVAGAGGPLTLRVEGPGAGAPPAVLRLAAPYRAALPLEPGTYRLEVVGAGGADSVRYHVR
jgi:penicillin-binding protein 1C